MSALDFDLPEWKISLLPLGAHLRENCSGCILLLTHRTQVPRAVKLYHVARGKPTPPPKHDVQRMRRELKAYAFIDRVLRRNKLVSEAFLSVLPPIKTPQIIRQFWSSTAETLLDPDSKMQLGTLHTRCLPVEWVEKGKKLPELMASQTFLRQKSTMVWRAAWLRRLLEILLECHRAGIAHNNLQLRHVIIDTDTGLTLSQGVRLIDWSSAVIKDEVDAKIWARACDCDARNLNLFNQVLVGKKRPSEQVQYVVDNEVFLEKVKALGNPDPPGPVEGRTGGEVALLAQKGLL